MILSNAPRVCPNAKFEGPDCARERLVTKRIGTVMLAAEPRLVTADGGHSDRIVLISRDFPPARF
jgi:hypothetical protein